MANEYTQAQRAKAVELYSLGLSARLVVDSLREDGMRPTPSRVTVRNWARHAGILRTMGGKDPGLRAKAIGLLRAGDSPRTIHERTGINLHTCFWWQTEFRKGNYGQA